MANTASTWLIVGASRGLGLELVRQLIATSNTVIAACRNPSSASQLQALEPTGAELHIIQLDVSSEESIRASVGKVEAVLNGRGLDYLYNNAGILAQDDAFNFSYSEFLAILQTNVVGPALLASLCLPFLEKGNKKTIVNVSSSMGGLTHDYGASAARYSASKAAMNMLTHKQAKTRPDLIVISLCPGWVQTDLGGVSAPLEPPESVAGQLKVVLGLKKEDTGKFIRYDGQELTW
ncbi:NAD-P-binding protein [Rhodofomes roseus]|uniref:NAD-P-binding protein n=1 Tax=Rhodofomes roseus TaxID=34475 RepID=A0ABQ8KEJ0_9APHY|nr:NAD-P-binding protein [Rhodofomes roseus]KAH9836044.1 NAD-P-binding protein [Rhodofomes roseus]